MMKYRDIIGSIVDSTSYREATEWSNSWYDTANSAVTEKRYLIIGDSTARMVRSTLAKMIGAPVDLLGTSSAIDDELFVQQIDSFFNENYKYDVIFVQLGHHGRISHEGGCYCDGDFIKFNKDYLCLLTFLKQYCNSIVVETIFDSVVSKTGYINLILKKLHILKEEEDEAINACTKKKK